ncbi:hypothetical protein I7I50_06624 [Histoplasma capsulatum G186AR]|uniref:Uncharacterized protein n=1 Tax=Ajellomyces capsulatus TaxID=5037 RepID=A0A8H8D4V7_AJECA|nr:hypothetical protein I7I52_10305 [Histoplasma capsulatum]QSS67519.1 hypothetical protein I7I50_06624 [Histoplasma capsulatum G186AR]
MRLSFASSNQLTSPCFVLKQLNISAFCYWYFVLFSYRYIISYLKVRLYLVYNNSFAPEFGGAFGHLFLKVLAAGCH